jgi:hypothetical protein
MAIHHAGAMMPQPSKTRRHHLRAAAGAICVVVIVAVESLLSPLSAALREVSMRVLAAAWSGDGEANTSAVWSILSEHYHERTMDGETRR